MAQVANIKLTSTWASIESLVGEVLEDDDWAFDATKTYQIQAQYPSRTILLEPSAEPDETVNEGVILQKGQVVEYKKGNNTLYGRSNIETEVNITVMGE